MSGVNYVAGHKLVELYQNKKYHQLLLLLEDTMVGLEKVFYTRIGRDEQLKIDDLAAAIIYIFSRPEFVIPNEHVGRLISMNHLIANFFACSSFKTTDGILRTIKNQSNNLFKIFCLYSCRNELLFDYNTFFEVCPELATPWWRIYPVSVTGTTTKLEEDNLKQHYSIDVNKLKLGDAKVTPTYFDCSYVDLPGIDRPLKELLNRQSRAYLPEYQYSSALRKNGIAIVTGRWNKESAVYKSSFEQIKALTRKYRLTLIHLGEDTSGVDKSIFKRVIAMGDTSKGFSLKSLRDLDCTMAYYPDIGMSDESVAMSNIKIAPIMACGYGHPASTFGSLVDYFIGGQDTELPELALQNYSEKLVLVPGLGAHPVFPNYTRDRKPNEKLVINCCWTSSKINYSMLCNLRKIMDRVKTRVEIHLFPAWTIGRYNSMVPFVQSLNNMFGDEFVVYSERPYQEYLSILEQGDLTLDSWPFGGYNTVVDSFFVGCPVIALEGNRFYNRASSALLRRVGLDNLIARNQGEYVDKAVELLSSPVGMKAAREKLASVDDLRKNLCDNDEPGYFVKAIDFIMQNHKQLANKPGPFIIDP